MIAAAVAKYYGRDNVVIFSNAMSREMSDVRRVESSH